MHDPAPPGESWHREPHAAHKSPQAAIPPPPLPFPWAMTTQKIANKTRVLRATCATPHTRPVLEGGVMWGFRGGGGSGTQKFVCQKWPKEICPSMNLFFGGVPATHISIFRSDVSKRLLCRCALVFRLCA